MHRLGAKSYFSCAFETSEIAENAAPVAPKRTERVDDFADLSFGKIEL